MLSNPSRCFGENVPSPQKTPLVFHWDFNAAPLPPLAEFLSPKNRSSDIRHLKNRKQTKTKKTTLPPPAAVTDQNVSARKNETVPSKPQTTKKAKLSRYIIAQNRRVTFQKSSGQCTYVDSITGRRCEERKHLEVDHINPFAKGGDHSPENLQILCRAHNMMRARDEFGDRFIENKIAARRC